MKDLAAGFDGDTEEIKTEKYISSSGEEESGDHQGDKSSQVKH